MNAEAQPSKGIAVMLHVTNAQLGKQFYESYCMDLGFPCYKYPNVAFYADYHVTIGYIAGIVNEDIKPIKEYLQYTLRTTIALQEAEFEFGVATLMGSWENRVYIVALPKNNALFCKYNRCLELALKGFKGGQRYKLDSYTRKEAIIPHMNLYGQVGYSMEPFQIPDVLTELNKRFAGLSLPVGTLKIY